MKTFCEMLEQRTLFSALKPNVTFGLSGVARLPFDGPATLVTETADGKILAVGTEKNGVTGRVAFARFTAAGLPDSSFGFNGIVETMLGKCVSATVQGKGKIVVMVQQTNFVLVARFLPDGSVDRTFSDNGRIDVLFSASGPIDEGAIAVGANGKTVGVGFTGNNAAPFFFQLTRNGGFDYTFDGDAKVDLALRPYGVAVQEDGRIVVAGYVGQSSAGPTAVARFTTTGALDPTFGNGGYSDLPQPNVAYTRVIIDTDSTILIGGFIHGSFNGSYLDRLSATGTVLKDFPVFNGGNDTLEDIAVDPKSGVVTVVSDETLQQFNADGTAIDPNFDDIESFSGNAVGLTSNGDVLLSDFEFGKFSTLTRATENPRPNLALAANGTLVITGTASADTIGITLSNGSIRVRRDGVVRRFLAADVQRIDIQGLSGNDVIDWSGISIPTYCDAGTGSDSVTAGAGDDTVTAGAGEDTVRGGAGDDLIDGNSKTDHLFGDAGNDRLHGGDGNDQLVGGAGIDRLFGDGGNDTLLGDTGNDKLYGGNNADLVDGGDGTDIAQADMLDTQSSIETILP